MFYRPKCFFDPEKRRIEKNVIPASFWPESSVSTLTKVDSGQKRAGMTAQSKGRLSTTLYLSVCCGERNLDPF